MNPELRQKLAQYLEQDHDFRQIYDYTRQRFEAAPQLTAHNWEHAYRDMMNAIIIGEAEGADMTIVLPANIMHDIGFLYGATGRTHGEVGAEKLEEFLQAGQITLSEAKIKHIAACIRTHKGSVHHIEPETLEAKVVSDADMLEKLGPVGAYQLIRTFTEFNFGAAKLIETLDGVKDRTFQTKTGEQMAQKLRPFSEEFANALKQAYEPYRTDQEVPV